MNANLVNLTPHAVSVHRADKSPAFTLPPSGTVARVSTEIAVVGEVNGVPLTNTVFGAVTGLPPSAPDVFYVVSALVRAEANKGGRFDVLSPGALLRNESGQPIGCVGLEG